MRSQYRVVLLLNPPSTGQLLLNPPSAFVPGAGVQNARNEVPDPLDAKYALLDCDLELVNKSSDEYKVCSATHKLCSLHVC